MDSLPPEILCEVIRHLADLESLDGAIRASSALYRVFCSRCVELLDAVLDNGYLHQDSIFLLRIIALIRTGRFEFSSLQALQQRVTSASLIDTETFEPEYGLAPDPPAFRPEHLPQDMSLKVCLSVVSTSRRITSLMQQCLDTLLGRLRATKPYKAADETRLVTMDTVAEILKMEADDAARIPVQVEDIGAPTWYEEQIVYRALLQVQMITDLRRSVNSGNLRDWSVEEQRKLNGLSIYELYDLNGMTLTVALLSVWRSGRFTSLCEESVHEGAILTITDWVRDHEQITDEQLPNLSRARKGPAPVMDFDDECMFEGTFNYATTYYKRVLSTGAYEDYIISFDPYRHLGFSIWTEARLKGYGFLRHGRDTYNDLITWMSVLGQEDLAILKKGVRRAGIRDTRTLTTIKLDDGTIVAHKNPVSEYYTRLSVLRRDESVP